MLKPRTITTAAALLGLLNSMDAIAGSAPQSVELYFDQKTKQIVAEPGKDRIKLGAFLAAESLEQKMQELTAIESRLDAKSKALDEKLKQLEKLESAPAMATVAPQKAVPVKAESAPVQVTEEKKIRRNKIQIVRQIPCHCQLRR